MLAHNDLLCDIVDQLPDAAVRSEDLVRRYKRYRSLRGQYVPMDWYCSLMGEAQVRLAIEDVCRQYNGRIVMNPIKGGDKTDSFYFHTIRGEVVAQEHGGRLVAGFDALFLADDLPVVVEVKLQQPAHRNRSRGVQKAMNVRLVQEKMMAIKEYFQTEDFGYVLVLYPQVLRQNPGSVKNFQQYGGLAVPFCSESNQWKSDIMRIGEEYGILAPAA